MILRLRIAIGLTIIALTAAIIVPLERSHHLTINIGEAAAVGLALAVLCGLLGLVLVLASAIGMLFLRNWAKRLAPWATLMAAIGIISFLQVSRISASMSMIALTLSVFALFSWIAAIVLSRTERVSAHFVKSGASADRQLAYRN